MQTFKRNNPARSGLAAACLLLAAAGQAHATSYATSYAISYDYTDLPTLGGGYGEATAINESGLVSGIANNIYGKVYAIRWEGTYGSGYLSYGGGEAMAYDINNAGQMVGEGKTTSGAFRANLWSTASGASAADMGTLGGINSAIHGINNVGQAAGLSLVAGNGATHATLWSGSGLTDLGTLGGNNSGAKDINDAGQVAGSSQLAGNQHQHAFVWSGGALQDLGTLGGADSTAWAINSAGVVVGSSTRADSSRNHATRWTNGMATDLGTLGGDTSDAFGINSSGQVVGRSVDANGVEYSTLWTDGSVVNLDSFLDASAAQAGWRLRIASDINDAGSIVGTAFNSITYEQHGFLLSVAVAPAVPEPQTYALMLAGLGALAWARRRRRAV